MKQRIWIMGASEGIGAELARQWSGHGADLILSARSEDALASIAAEIGGAEVLPADVTDPASLCRAAEAIASRGSIDRAITLAALYEPGQVMQVDPELAARIVEVNMTGTFNFVRAAVPLLRPGGQLVLTGSIAGYVGLPQAQIYSATKAGVTNLAETLRAELAPQVDVRLISPGFVDTRMTRKNDFDMPGIIAANEAGRRIIKGLDARGFEIHFPRRMTFLFKLLRVLPYPLALRLTRRLVR
ncbi:SDR family NAD(P)-dependent oxidoreductase [Paracoccus sp. MBLB3053]|uniref:SDR family NAD(P)-dependent oxidoreductase n=1 Tax=Paracoccus aurantius TaxID=3073814 RepID=A0ABU2HYM7_9RHOB|nr:SDR family NAD(P)-dependent oxidoreductase [Paracoccus sp. MBLB3053]MDS9470156.1 SDR family NAD(P)-dependent oxidoreductase [Paracoccus sp. MBLB3053]